MYWIILACHWNNSGWSFKTITNWFCNWCFTNPWWTGEQKH